MRGQAASARTRVDGGEDGLDNAPQLRRVEGREYLALAVPLPLDLVRDGHHVAAVPASTAAQCKVLVWKLAAPHVTGMERGHIATCPVAGKDMLVHLRMPFVPSKVGCSMFGRIRQGILRVVLHADGLHSVKRDCCIAGACAL